MGVEYCETHNKYWDRDDLEDCPECFDKSLALEEQLVQANDKITRLEREIIFFIKGQR